MDKVQERKRKQWQFLFHLYETVDGRQRPVVNMWDLGDELDFSKDETSVVVECLLEEKLIKWGGLGGGIVITHAGVVEVENSYQETETNGIVNDEDRLRAELRGVEATLEELKAENNKGVLDPGRYLRLTTEFETRRAELKQKLGNLSRGQRIIAAISHENSQIDLPRKLSNRLRNRIISLRLGSEIYNDFESILIHKDYPTIMSVSGELVKNPIWQKIPVDARERLASSFCPSTDTCPRVMLLDIFFVRADDSNRNPRLLTYFSGKPHSGWQAFLFPFRHRPTSESEDERHSKSSKDIALFLGLQEDYVVVSSLGNQYVISVKPDPGYSDLVIYIFEFCSVQLLAPPSWLSAIDCKYQLEHSVRRFHWFHLEDLEHEHRTMLVNADLIRAIHSLFSTTIPGVPVSVPCGFLNE